MEVEAEGEGGLCGGGRGGGDTVMFRSLSGVRIHWPEFRTKLEFPNEQKVLV